MTNAIATTRKQVEIDEQTVSSVATNSLANIWLAFLALCLVGTFFCTVVLLAWPIVAQMAAG